MQVRKSQGAAMHQSYDKASILSNATRAFRFTPSGNSTVSRFDRFSRVKQRFAKLIWYIVRHKLLCSLKIFRSEYSCCNRVTKLTSVPTKVIDPGGWPATNLT